jgi:large subunit ribosomal protein L13
MKALMKTTKSAKPAEVEKKWHLIDADGLVVGRLATIVANILRGKHKPSYTPHVDCGDHVVIINADKVRFTGRKLEQKVYYKHTGYPGGIKEITAGKVLEGRFPERVLEGTGAPRRGQQRVPDPGPVRRSEPRSAGRKRQCLCRQPAPGLPSRLHLPDLRHVRAGGAHR